jgi:hypothetical protein
VQEAGAEIEGRQRHQPEDHDREDVLHVEPWSIFRKSGYRFSAENATT